MSSNPSNLRGGVTSHQHNSVNPVDKSSPRECYDLDIVKDNPSFQRVGLAARLRI